MVCFCKWNNIDTSVDIRVVYGMQKIMNEKFTILVKCCWVVCCLGGSNPQQIFIFSYSSVGRAYDC